MLSSVFILGREPALSIAEIESRASDWGGQVIDLDRDWALVEHNHKLPDQLIDRLGGTIKISTVESRWPITGSIVETLEKQITTEWLRNKVHSQSRLEFGLSLYGGKSKDREAVKKFGLNLKKKLVKEGNSVRYITSKDPQLSAVTVNRQGLLKKGAEFVILVNGESLIIGQTVAVQDYQAYGLRDFGRPESDPKSGMIPPKVAQLMLNISQIKTEDILLDPFCGSGTILQEAAVIGIKKIFGSDADAEAVRRSQGNIRWLLKEYPDLQPTVEMTVNDARQVGTRPDVIVTEPFLGKPLHGNEREQTIRERMKQLQLLYRQTFDHWSTLMKSGSRVVMIWPEFKVKDISVKLNITNEVAQAGFVSQPLISKLAGKKLGIENRHVLTYGRPDAKVIRHIRYWLKP